jgi:hypothetical protein
MRLQATEAKYKQKYMQINISKKEEVNIRLNSIQLQHYPNYG